MRPAVAVLALGLAFAIGAPIAWAVTRPPVAAGPPVTQVLGSDPAAGPSAAPGPSTRPATPPVTPALPPPVRLAVPAHGVDSAVDPVGVEPDGQMTIPADVARVGWYRFGPAPGAPGSAVIAGHVDDRTQGLGALAPLRAAAPGDEVLVTDAAGTTSRWRVVSRELISKQVLPLDELFRRDGPPRLTLITCGGPFLPEYGSYRDNVVVVAEPVA
jgi:hypothetical protein